MSTPAINIVGTYVGLPHLAKDKITKLFADPPEGRQSIVLPSVFFRGNVGGSASFNSNQFQTRISQICGMWIDGSSAFVGGNVQIGPFKYVIAPRTQGYVAIFSRLPFIIDIFLLGSGVGSSGSTIQVTVYNFPLDSGMRLN